MATVIVKCPHCGGSGKAPVDRALAETLAVMSDKSWTTAVEIFAKLKTPYLTEPTAVNNRLTKLFHLGLVQREARGRTYFWKRIK